MVAKLLEPKPWEKPLTASICPTPKKERGESVEASIVKKYIKKY